MRFKNSGRAREDAIAVIRNAETSIAIKQGAPVFLALNGVEDGLNVVSAEGLSANRYNLFFGFNCFPGDLNPGSIGESIVFGFVQQIRFFLNSRASSTDVWASYPAGVVGDILDVVSIAGIQAMSQFSSGLYTQGGFFAALGEAYASGASSASATSDTRTAITNYYKAFVRAL